MGVRHDAVLRTERKTIAASRLYGGSRALATSRRATSEHELQPRLSAKLTGSAALPPVNTALRRVRRYGPVGEPCVGGAALSDGGLSTLARRSPGRSREHLGAG